ncbi:MAG: hypothetical protein NVSMB57_06490 [Actinomycetota bacterium]
MLIARVACELLLVYKWILIARMLTSWFPRPPDALRPVFRVLFILTEPVLRLVRPLIPPIRVGGGYMDVSPLLVFVLLIIAERVVCSYA